MQNSNLNSVGAPPSIPRRVANSARTLCVSLLKHPDPKEIHYLSFAVTYQCNSKCIQCNIWKRYQDKPNEINKELSLEQIKNRLCNSQYLAYLKVIVLVGGEPFMRNDFVAICNLFARRYPNASITIPTNAVDPVLVASKLKEINSAYDNNRIHLSVSLDGIGIKHDQCRGTTDNYENALQLLEYVRDCLPTVGLGVSFTITPANYEHLYGVYQLSKKTRVGFNCQFANKSQNYYANNDILFEWKQKELEYVKKELNLILRDSSKQNMKIKNDPRTLYFSKMVDYQLSKGMTYRCLAGTHSVFIDPYGSVFSCIMRNEPMGNILNSCFDQIWFSTEAKEIRRSIKNKECSCWIPGEAIPSLSRNNTLTLMRYLNRLVEVVKN